MTVPLVDHVTVVIAGMTDAMIAETIVEMTDGMTAETGAMIDGMIGATIADNFGVSMPQDTIGTSILKELD